MISIIIPTLNEAAAIGTLIGSLKGLRGDYEIIVADGGSVDETVRIARGLGLKVAETTRGRGRQMNAGASLATGDVLLFLHADTRLPQSALPGIERLMQDPGVCGGNFTLLFDGGSLESRLLTVIYPMLRLGGMCYGDSAIFVRRCTFETLGGYRDYPIFEDCDLYRRMQRLGRFVRLSGCVTTSSRRFEGRFLRTFALWSVMQGLYWLGVHPKRLAALYKQLR